MLKNTLTLFLFIFLFFQGFSQNTALRQKYMERAEEYYSVENYVAAMPLYKEIIKIDSNYVQALYKLAECERKTFNYQLAKEYYQKTISKKPKNYPETLSWYYYARMLKANAEYEKAKISFEKFLGEFTSSKIPVKYKNLAEKEYKGCLMAINEVRNGFKTFDLGLLKDVSSKHHDILPTLITDSLLIVSSLRTSIDEDKEEINVEKDNYEQYRYQFEKGKWQEYKSNKDRFSVVNSQFNDISGSFTKQKDKYYFTRCNIQKGESQGLECGIYVSKNKNGKWQDPKPIKEINTPQSWNGTPSVSANGDTLFFVSNRKGGVGGYDIWYSYLTDKEEETWSKPRNLRSINTTGKETYPRYYSEYNTLFFSSDGFGGFGETDIIAARGEDFLEVKNIGMPFNSSREDIFFELGDKKGYLSSNRSGGAGKDDIYEYSYKSKKALINYIFSRRYQTNFFSIKGRIMDTDGNPSSVTAVLLTDENGNIVKRVMTDKSGRYDFGDLGNKKGYKVIFGDADLDVVFAEAIPLEVSDEWTIEGELLDLYVSDESMRNQSINEDSTLSQTKTPKVRCLFEKVYFNYSSKKIRSEGKKTLDALVDFYKKYPNIEIDIHTHTDNTGTKEQNLLLAKQRGFEIKKYITSKGVKEEMIVIKSFGESTPIASNTDNQGRQLNRRAEIYIQGGNFTYEPKYTIYIVEPRKTIYEVAKAFDMTVQELKQLNGLKSNILISYKPLRVKRLNSIPNERDYAKKRAERYIKSAGGEIKYNEKDDSGYYTVLPKNTLYSIAKLYGINVQKLVDLNNLKNNTIKIGQKLRLRDDVPYVPFKEKDEEILDTEK